MKKGIRKFIKAAKACGLWDEILITTVSDFGRRFEENVRRGTDHGWGSHYVLFGKGLRRKVFGYDPDKASAKMADIVPDMLDAKKESRGDIPVITPIELWNSCILDAMALPGLTRLPGPCPAEMRLRNNLPGPLPVFNETVFENTNIVFTKQTSTSVSASSLKYAASTRSTQHLDGKLTGDQILHVSRRVGFSPRSLNLKQFIFPGNPLQNDGVSNATAAANKTITLRSLIQKLLPATGGLDTRNKPYGTLDNKDLLAKGYPLHVLSQTEYPRKVYYSMNVRKFRTLSLWTQVRRDWRNNWDDLLAMPYPYYDPIER